MFLMDSRERSITVKKQIAGITFDPFLKHEWRTVVHLYTYFADRVFESSRQWSGTIKQMKQRLKLETFGCCWAK